MLSGALCANLLGYRLQSVTKIMGRTAIWTNLYFYYFPPLNNVEKQ